MAVYGGANIATQIAQPVCHVVIATPGRLIDLAKRKVVKLDRIRHLVLDEADEMGFKEELDEILSFTPEDKSTWLLGHDAAKSDEWWGSTCPIHSRSRSSTVNQNIEHQYASSATDQRGHRPFPRLDPGLYGVVFCRTPPHRLWRKNFSSAAAPTLHGEMSQAQRDRVMLRFKQKHLQALVATDVAARGIDVDDLTHVFHHSLPGEAAQYAHRPGRTARAGNRHLARAHEHQGANI